GALRALAGGRPERAVGPSERAAKAKHAGKHGRPAVVQAVTVVHPSTSTGLPPVVIPTGDGGAQAPVEDATVIVAPVPPTVPTDPTAPAEAPVTGPPGTASTGSPTGAASTGTPGDPTAAAMAPPGSASAPVAQAAQTGVSSGSASGGAPAPAERPSPRGS
ncbi:MAG: hypothetical protein JWN65_4040, partial [Solirubrobacterales bacterium]|nr:hypothetical protein [Solirubrobacterales bacterium]